jgi:hypothetical protein
MANRIATAGIGLRGIGSRHGLETAMPSPAFGLMRVGVLHFCGGEAVSISGLPLRGVKEKPALSFRQRGFFIHGS